MTKYILQTIIGSGVIEYDFPLDLDGALKEEVVIYEKEKRRG